MMKSSAKMLFEEILSINAKAILKTCDLKFELKDLLRECDIFENGGKLARVEN